MSDVGDNVRSSPTSTTSGNLSSDMLPSTLAKEELQLALNKVVILSIQNVLIYDIFLRKLQKKN